MLFTGWYAPVMEMKRRTPEYDVTTMTLREMLTVLIDHEISFEQQREMTFPEIVTVFERINAGELQSYTQKQNALKAAQQAARERGRSK